MAVLYVMCGIPGSGKTTFVKQCDLQGAIHVSRDECRFKLLNDGDEYFSKEKEVFDNFISEIDANINLGFDVFADATHCNVMSRRRLFQSIKSHPIEIRAIWFETPLNVCLERNAQREGLARVPDKALRDFYKRRQRPTFEEGFSTIYTVRPNCHIQVEKELK